MAERTWRGGGKDGDGTSKLLRIVEVGPNRAAILNEDDRQDVAGPAKSVAPERLTHAERQAVEQALRRYYCFRSPFSSSPERTAAPSCQPRMSSAQSMAVTSRRPPHAALQRNPVRPADRSLFAHQLYLRTRTPEARNAPP